MKLKIHTPKIVRSLLLGGGSLLLLSSCATTNTATLGETDGIYVSAESTARQNTDDNDKNNYYKQYFKSKENAYGQIPEEGAIFTDIEAYSTNEYVDGDGYIVIEERGYTEGYGGWGNNSDNVTVNVYNNGFGNYWGGFYQPFFGGYWGNGFGYGGYWGRP
ncbi:MAG: hypothetical protein ACPGU0_06545, partial [Marinirhabdus sp.]